MLMKKENQALWRKYSNGIIEKLSVKNDMLTGIDYLITEISYPPEIASKTGVYFERTTTENPLAQLTVASLWRCAV